jgi:hypothetical protein
MKRWTTQCAREQNPQSSGTGLGSCHMARRGISMPLLNNILLNPEEVAEVRPGRVILQSRAKIGTSSQLVRVFDDVGGHLLSNEQD